MCFTLCAGMLSWLDCRWFHAAGGGHPCEHRGSHAAGRNCTGAKEKQPRQGCSPGELDVPLRKEMRAGCAGHRAIGSCLLSLCCFPPGTVPLCCWVICAWIWRGREWEMSSRFFSPKASWYLAKNHLPSLVVFFNEWAFWFKVKLKCLWLSWW